ncbi:MAG TPA: CehA/McbA family metallohydrolase [Candidatus Acidoferrum sp.]|nr:CehA/McbA family metallohydrolase [Candidatus Acidoferrum sp.]
MRFFTHLRYASASWLLAAVVAPNGMAQNIGETPKVALQPLAQHVRQVEEALSFLGQPLLAADSQRINAAMGLADESAAVSELERVLDQHALAIVTINAESRVKVEVGEAKPELEQDGTRLFLVKVINGAGVTAKLQVQSENSGAVYAGSNGSAEPVMKLTPEDEKQRWADISFYDKNPMSERLSGLGLEYRILSIYSRDAGERSAKLSFNVGQGTQDAGFRNEATVLFKILPANKLRLSVVDENKLPTIAAFTIHDEQGRVYPNPSKRLAPDFFFQPQVYRHNGESIALAKGSYAVKCTLGPEYLPQTKQVEMTERDGNRVEFQMRRWIDPSKYGWYSGDHHVHAAGCSHYQDPTQGVRPEDMARQVQGERLNVSCVLTWGPCYYYQKKFFTGKDDPHSKPDELMHYDLEVSGFPSSHAGHLVLLGLTEQDYPGTKRIEDWPTWDLPILRWGKSQKAVVGFAHSGWGLEVKSSELPNYEMPGFDGIGANEYIVDVTYPDTVDFISTMDTPSVWELNIWYHTLNVGFRTRVSGETDFPCITDSRVGQGRVYAKVDGELTYAKWLEAVREGRSYVSDGRSHLMDFRANGIEVGTHNSEVHLPASGSVHVALKAAAYLTPAADLIPHESAGDQPSWILKTVPNDPDDALFGTPGGLIRDRPYSQRPYWHIERARIGNMREVAVEIVVDGKTVARKNIVADGQVRDLEFDVPVERSSWIVARILPSSHTNPIFVTVNGKPMRPLRASAEWCLAAVDQCWTQKAPKISAQELPDARQAYDHAREVYRKLIAESTKQ